MPKVYRITSTIPGFRRAGLSHPARAVDHPAGSLTPEQLDALQAEPRLVVQELDLPDDAPPLQLEGAGGDDTAASAPNQIVAPETPGTADSAPASGEPDPAGDDKAGKPAKAAKAKTDGE